MAYLIAAVVMTLSVLEDNSPIRNLLSAVFRICGASTELLVYTPWSIKKRATFIF